MSEIKTFSPDAPVSGVEDVKERIHLKCAQIVDYCTDERKGESFFIFEKALMGFVFELGCLFVQLYLVACHERLSYDAWLSDGNFYLKRQPVGRWLKTVFGKAFYQRFYLVKKKAVAYSTRWMRRWD